MTLSPTKLDGLIQLRDLLEPFKKATVVLSASKYATSSLGLAVIKVMAEACLEIEDDQRQQLTNFLKRRLNDKLSQYFYQNDVDGQQLKPIFFIYQEAAYLDPLYRHSLTASESQVVVKHLLNNKFRKRSTPAAAAAANDAGSLPSASLQSKRRATMDNLLESVGLAMDMEPDDAAAPMRSGNANELHHYDLLCTLSNQIDAGK